MRDTNQIIYTINAATENDINDILKLYHLAIGSEGCTWSEEYPNATILRDDFLRNALFCGKKEDGEIISAISIDADAVVDALPNWSNNSAGTGVAAELARLVVREDYQNRGIARQMIRYMMTELTTRGYDYVHFLVSQSNERALRSYAKLQYENRGEAELFGVTWWCYEHRLS
jgi:ribosomal protein S18 acetylase RimI-like enzyme